MVRSKSCKLTSWVVKEVHPNPISYDVFYMHPNGGWEWDFRLPSTVGTPIWRLQEGKRCPSKSIPTGILANGSMEPWNTFRFWRWLYTPCAWIIIWRLVIKDFLGGGPRALSSQFHADLFHWGVRIAGFVNSNPDSIVIITIQQFNSWIVSQSSSKPGFLSAKFNSQTNDLSKLHRSQRIMANLCFGMFWSRCTCPHVMPTPPSTRKWFSPKH